MPSHIALLVAIMSVKNNRLFSYGLANDLVFISGKYVIENLEQCVTISYASVINSENPNCEFDVSNVPECVPHCIFLVTANRKLKEIEDYVRFGVESVEYNTVTGNISAIESMENLVDAGVETGYCSRENEKKSHGQSNCVKLDDQDNENDRPDFEDKDELDEDTLIKDEECEENLQPKK
ncbi:hypothetical protein C2G38_2310624 [Gigaspora rosea]|uniref:Uncharacterized protein n=1 Tax=Gigaspora rosea TaxID=44941 RepID=A0A397VAJ9_9GLOM|nr:hypothetical protein C2G38_2310624 [Gigaspora rosea]